MSNEIDIELDPLPIPRPKWVGYFVTLLIEIILTVVLVAMRPYLPLGEHAAPYVVTIMAVAYWIGEGPAVLAFVMGLLLFKYFFISPEGHLWPIASSPSGWASLASFCIHTSVFGIIIFLMRRSERRMRRLAKELQGSRETVRNQLSFLQQALVPPKSFTTIGYKVAAIYLPAFREPRIGGDFYDVFSIENGQIGVVIGDVSGKGVEAAALAAAARSTVRSFAYELSVPGIALHHANAVLQSQESGSGRFVTVTLITIDPSTGNMSYARAGHPPTAILRANGTVEFLEHGNMPIGIMVGQKYETFEDHLDLGDKIVLYTDGITEARRGTELFDEKGIFRALITHGHGTPDEVAAGLLEAARDWAEGKLRDDVAILVIERTEAGLGTRVCA